MFILEKITALGCYLSHCVVAYSYSREEVDVTERLE